MPLESIEKMIDASTEVRNKAIVSLLYSSGLRVGELCRLVPSDIYMSTMQVHIRGGKNHCDHWTILSQKSLDLLTEYWKSYPVQRDHLFVGLKVPHAPLCAKRRMAGVTIQDVFLRFLPDYAEIRNFSTEQYMATTCILKCRTAEMGAHVSECDNCHTSYIHYNSCKNRHCPMCQGMEVDEWIDKRQEDVLETPYFHTVYEGSF